MFSVSPKEKFHDLTGDSLNFSKFTANASCMSSKSCYIFPGSGYGQITLSFSVSIIYAKIILKFPNFQYTLIWYAHLQNPHFTDFITRRSSKSCEIEWSNINSYLVRFRIFHIDKLVKPSKKLKRSVAFTFKMFNWFGFHLMKILRISIKLD